MIEGLNARAIGDAGLGRFDLVVGDLSFISLTLVLPALAPLLDGDLLMLVKPQFELQPADIGKGGLVQATRPRIRGSSGASGGACHDGRPRRCATTCRARSTAATATANFSSGQRAALLELPQKGTP